MRVDGDSLLALHDVALRAAAISALRDWFSEHSRRVTGRSGRQMSVPSDMVGQQIARALVVLGEPLDREGS